MLPDRYVVRLRNALRSADFTVSAVAELLGPEAHQALGRNETTPALRRTSTGGPVATLTRLWLLQTTVTVAEVKAVLPGLVEAMTAAGILESSAGEVRASVDIRPYADDTSDWWVASDLTPGLDGARKRLPPDHVLGVSSASASLAQLTVRGEVGSALDIGTGCAVQALHLSRHARRVVGTDVNPRCLDLAALTAALNEVDLDLRSGSLFEPVEGELFDLIVTNPPFVISAGVDDRLVYRDSGLPGDELVRRVVTGAAAHLEPGGWCQLLANWVHRRGEAWDDRVRRWIEPTGCDAWVVQREVVDVTQYVELWLNDAGMRGATDYTDRYDAWLRWFESEDVEAVGFGWVSLRKTGHDRAVVDVEHWPYDIEQPIGPTVSAWSAGTDALREHTDEKLLAARLRVTPDVVEERIGPPGAADPERIMIRQQRGMRRAQPVSTAQAAFVGACDGDLAVGQIADALASLLDSSSSLMRADLLQAARLFVHSGFLTFSD